VAAVTADVVDAVDAVDAAIVAVAARSIAAATVAVATAAAFADAGCLADAAAGKAAVVHCKSKSSRGRLPEAAFSFLCPSSWFDLVTAIHRIGLVIRRGR
jgi:hypothetical protein